MALTDITVVAVTGNYSWAPSTGLSATTGTVVYTAPVVTVLTTSTYTLTATSAFTDVCSSATATDVFTISVYPGPDLAVNSNSTFPLTVTATCAGATLTATSSNTATFFEWETEDGIFYTSPLQASVDVSEGTYTVHVISYDLTGWGCCASGTVIVNPWGCTPCHKLEGVLSDSIKTESPITVFPNPADGYCFIQGYSSEDEEAIITISNLAGQILNRQKVHNEKGNWKYKIELPQTGMYIINLTTETRSFHSSVISIKE